MTVQNKATIKSYFETGDKPTQQNFIDLVDSYADFGSGLTALTGDVTITTPVSGSAVATISNAAVTGAKIANATITATQIANKAITAALLNSGVAVSGAVATADGVGGVSYAAPVSVGSELVLLGTATASNSATIDFTSLISASYDLYMIVVSNLVQVSSGVLLIRNSIDNGATFDATSAHYSTTVNTTGFGATSYTVAAGTVTTGISIGPVSGQAMDAQIWFSTAQGSAAAVMFSGWMSSGSNAQRSCNFFGMNTAGSGSPLNAIRLLQSAGNMASGKIYLYGVKNT